MTCLKRFSKFGDNNLCESFEDNHNDFEWHFGMLSCIEKFKYIWITTVIFRNIRKNIKIMSDFL